MIRFIWDQPASGGLRRNFRSEIQLAYLEKYIKGPITNTYYKHIKCIYFSNPPPYLGAEVLNKIVTDCLHIKKSRGGCRKWFIISGVWMHFILATCPDHPDLIWWSSYRHTSLISNFRSEICLVIMMTMYFLNAWAPMLTMTYIYVQGVFLTGSPLNLLNIGQ